VAQYRFGSRHLFIGSVITFEFQLKIIPNSTKFRLLFRNKTRTNKIKKYDLRKNRTNFRVLTMFSFLPQYPTHLCHNLISPSQIKYDTVFQSHDKTNKKSNEATVFQSHNFTNALLYGNFGIAFRNHATIRASFVETIRLDISKILKKKAKVWLRLCCDTPVTERPVETRMGKGKGSVSYWSAKVVPGQIFFEFDGINHSIARTLFQSLKTKCSISLKLIRAI
jgi:large subunit ribosomal protein L16